MLTLTRQKGKKSFQYIFNIRISIKDENFQNWYSRSTDLPLKLQSRTLTIDLKYKEQSRTNGRKKSFQSFSKEIGQANLGFWTSDELSVKSLIKDWGFQIYILRLEQGY